MPDSRQVDEISERVDIGAGLATDNYRDFWDSWLRRRGPNPLGRIPSTRMELRGRHFKRNCN